MTALYVLAAAALVLFFLGQVRVGGQAELNGNGFFLWLRVGTFRVQILPSRSGKKKQDAPTSGKKRKPQKPKKPKPEKPPVPLPEKLGTALEYAKALLPVILDAAGKLGRALRVDILDLTLTAGAPDPADAALAYGRANAALGALWVPLTAALRVKEGRAQVKIDFEASGMTVYGTAALSIKAGAVVWTGLRSGWNALFGALAAKKRLKLKRQQRKAA